MQVLSLVSGEVEPRQALEATRLLFDEPSYAAIDAMDLTMNEYLLLLETAVDLVMGGDGEGNAETPATT